MASIESHIMRSQKEEDEGDANMAVSFKCLSCLNPGGIPDQRPESPQDDRVGHGRPLGSAVWKTSSSKPKHPEDLSGFRFEAIKPFVEKQLEDQVPASKAVPQVPVNGNTTIQVGRRTPRHGVEKLRPPKGSRYEPPK